jgi:hypothetical protein
MFDNWFDIGIDWCRCAPRVMNQLQRSGSVRTCFFPLVSGGTGIVVWIRMVAVSRVTFSGFALRKRDGTPVAVRWAEYCDSHKAFCIHEWLHGVLPVSPSIMQEVESNLSALKRAFMTAGDEFIGYLVGETSEHLYSMQDAARMFLVVKAGFEDEYFFPISLASSCSVEKPQSRSATAEEKKEVTAIVQRIKQQIWDSNRARRQSARELIKARKTGAVPPSPPDVKI